ncbi:hypothetical protein M0R45_004540 [Rubus argutus]|uniref:Protein RER1 n=1 Tax=Rubus argutus TaxID=59490 RepID=A0AAW1YK43_RUBAR
MDTGAAGVGLGRRRRVGGSLEGIAFRRRLGMEPTESSRRLQHLLDKNDAARASTAGWVDPEIQDLSDGPSLPTRGSDEFRPFVRRLPEFKFWYSITKAFCIAFVMTFFSAFDVPVFWPILLFYWLVLFVLTMRRQIIHMIKYKYVPFSIGKQRYDGKKASASETTSLLPRD